MFKQEGTNILDQLMTLGVFLDVASGGSERDELMAAKVSACELKSLLIPGSG